MSLLMMFSNEVFCGQNKHCSFLVQNSLLTFLQVSSGKIIVGRTKKRKSGGIVKENLTITLIKKTFLLKELDKTSSNAGSLWIHLDFLGEGSS